MLKPGLSVVLFVVLLFGALYSHGNGDDKKARVITDELGHQRCKECKKRLDICRCRCSRCSKFFREKRLIARKKIRKKGQSDTPSDKDPEPSEVYLSTENTCQCDDNHSISEPPTDPRLKPDCRKRRPPITLDGPSTSKMALLASSGGSVSGEVVSIPIPVPDTENQLDCEWINQQVDFSSFQQQAPVVVVPPCQQQASSTSSFNVCHLENNMVPVTFQASNNLVQHLQQVVTQAQAAIQQDFVTGLISIGWMSGQAQPLGNVQVLEDGYYVLALPNPQGGFFIALIVVEEKMTFVFLLNQAGGVSGYVSDNQSLIIWGINCYLNTMGGQLYRILLPVTMDVLNYMLETAVAAFDQMCPDDAVDEDLLVADCEGDAEVILVSDCPMGHDVAIRQCFMDQMANGPQKIPLPQGLDESQLPDLYALMQLMEVNHAMTALEVDLEVEELQALNSVQQLMTTALDSGVFIMVIQAPNEQTFVVIISVNATGMTLRMLCFSDNLRERASLRAVSGLVCEWNRALQVLVCILRAGHSVQVYRLRSREDSNN
ncbi:hypothetical protein [Endozoicomonas arenosclerae]|uniref:hypothetical protein n=1 Tax=Endozoicomonas arenosclerae TaxID=1633495 RepID=UPI0007834386|nr:hypothetical protein [Endozoicomonas arenosclerae]